MLMRKQPLKDSKDAGNQGPLVAFSLLKLAFRPAAERMLTLILSGHIYIGQRDAGAAQGAVMVVPLQSREGNARLGTTVGASHECFTSRHG